MSGAQGSLGAFLDDGSAPVDVLGRERLEVFLDALTSIEWLTVAERRDRAVHSRSHAVLYGERGLATHALAETWEAEILDDVDLLPRFIAACPADVQQMFVTSRDLSRRPFPLDVQQADGGGWWQCSSCGTRVTSGPMIAVTFRPGYSDIDPVPTYCVSCVRLAIEVAESGLTGP